MKQGDYSTGRDEVPSEETGLVPFLGRYCSYTASVRLAMASAVNVCRTFCRPSPPSCILVDESAKIRWRVRAKPSGSPGWTRQPPPVAATSSGKVPCSVRLLGHRSPRLPAQRSPWAPDKWSELKAHRYREEIRSSLCDRGHQHIRRPLYVLVAGVFEAVPQKKRAVPLT